MFIVNMNSELKEKRYETEKQINLVLEKYDFFRVSDPFDRAKVGKWALCTVFFIIAGSKCVNVYIFL